MLAGLDGRYPSSIAVCFRGTGANRMRRISELE